MSGYQPVEFELINGPQDGGKVRRVCESMPQTIYLGGDPKGDGFAAWGSDPCARFPHRYNLVGHVFVYYGKAIGIIR